MKKTKKKKVKFSVEIHVLDEFRIKAELKEKGIKLTRKEYNALLDHIAWNIDEQYSDQVSEIEDQVNGFLEDTLEDIKRELKKPKEDRDILTYN